MIQPFVEIKIIEIETEDLQRTDEAAYLGYLNERDAVAALAREKYPQEYAEYKKRELERARRILDADSATA